MKENSLTEKEKVIDSLIKTGCKLHNEALNRATLSELEAHFKLHQQESLSGEWPEDP
jgi:hypothetical protein